MSSRPLPEQPHAHNYLTHPMTVAVVGMGYVGLPTAAALRSAGAHVIGIDVSQQRLDAIVNQTAELIPEDQERLARALSGDPALFRLTTDPAALADADAVIIAVPTPVLDDLTPDLTAVRAACATVVAHAHAGQTIILTSTTYVGCTRDLLVDPLTAAGFTPGEDIHIAFAPERIDPGNVAHPLSTVPRVLGAVSAESHEHAWTVLRLCAPTIHPVSSMEAAEMTKLLENTYRAVNIAWINEMADAALHLGLDISEVIDAAASKPYGFTPFRPGPGVGGHCIPCDPHYLLNGLPDGSAPITEMAMRAIDHRPHQIVDRAVLMLAEAGIRLSDATILIAGVSYKPNIQDSRESPAIDIITDLTARGATVLFYDPLVDTLVTPVGSLDSVAATAVPDADLVIWHTGHDAMNPARLLAGARRVLDTTYRLHLDGIPVIRP